VDQHPSEDRLSVWVTLSELFVGRALGDADYEHAASTLATSGYSIDQLERILTNEVSPALRSNLGMLGVPEMLGWAPDELRAIICSRRARTSFVSRWIRQKPPRVVRDRWRVVRSILEQRLRKPSDA
jgi:hypothetical protein